MEVRSSYTNQGGRAGQGYRLDSFDVVQKGRRREFRRTGLITIGLFLLQGPLRSAASGDRTSEYSFSAEVPGRLSLLVDVLFILAYLLVAYRAFGLIRSCLPRPWALRLNKTGLVLIVVGASLDFWEDVRLWHILGDTDVRHDVTRSDCRVPSQQSRSSGAPRPARRRLVACSVRSSMSPKRCTRTMRSRGPDRASCGGNWR